MRKAVWRLALFWPLVVLWTGASAAHFVFSDRLATVLSVFLAIAGIVALELWARRFDRTGSSVRLMRRLKIEPHDLGL